MSLLVVAPEPDEPKRHAHQKHFWKSSGHRHCTTMCWLLLDSCLVGSCTSSNSGCNGPKLGKKFKLGQDELNNIFSYSVLLSILISIHMNFGSLCLVNYSSGSSSVFPCLGDCLNFGICSWGKQASIYHHQIKNMSRHHHTLNEPH